jgi:hypothetical protein
MMRKVYKVVPGVDAEKAFKDFVTFKLLEFAKQSQTKITFKEALFGSRYRRSTWISFMLAIGNQWSAIGPVNLFASTLIAQILKVDDTFPLTITQGVFLVGLMSLVLGVIGIIPLNYFGRITILAWSHGTVALCHALTGIFAYHE